MYLPALSNDIWYAALRGDVRARGSRAAKGLANALLTHATPAVRDRYTKQQLARGSDYGGLMWQRAGSSSPECMGILLVICGVDDESSNAAACDVAAGRPVHLEAHVVNHAHKVLNWLRGAKLRRTLSDVASKGPGAKLLLRSRPSSGLVFSVGERNWDTLCRLALWDDDEPDAVKPEAPISLTTAAVDTPADADEGCTDTVVHAIEFAGGECPVDTPADADEGCTDTVVYAIEFAGGECPVCLEDLSPSSVAVLSCARPFPAPRRGGDGASRADGARRRGWGSSGGSGRWSAGCGGGGGRRRRR